MECSQNWFHLAELGVICKGTWSTGALCRRHRHDDDAYRVCRHGLTVETTSVSLGVDIEAASHQAPTISMPHWWAPIRVKQLSVALPSFVRWLERWSLVATNRTSVPLAMVLILLTWSGLVKYPVITTICYSLASLPPPSFSPSLPPPLPSPSPFLSLLSLSPPLPSQMPSMCERLRITLKD